MKTKIKTFYQEDYTFDDEVSNFMNEWNKTIIDVKFQVSWDNYNGQIRYHVCVIYTTDDKDI